MNDILITNPFGLLAVLLAIPAAIFILKSHTKFGKKLFGVVPALVFAYFIPTLLTFFNIIPPESIIYSKIKTFVLPASLLLLTLAVDIHGIMKLGNKAIIMFLTGTLGVVIGGPISLLIFRNHLPAEIWRGMSALAGSWIGGGANFIAIGQSVNASAEMMGMMVVIDVIAANLLTGALLFFAGKYEKIDQKT